MKVEETTALNYYGQPIIDPGQFMEMHVANPMGAGMPPVCSCGWTRWEYAQGKWFEMYDHLREMGEFAEGVAPLTASLSS